MTTALPALNDPGRALASVTRLTAGIGEDQRTRDTPCTEWNVHALLHHLRTGNLSFAAQLRREPAPQGGVNHLGTDPHGAFLDGGTGPRLGSQVQAHVCGVAADRG
jgi:Mycothiol maleylpyruvate isomerase N-terminal domain